MKRVEVAIGIVVQAGKILICQRPAEGPLAGYWEFPGGKREEPESLEQTLVRELREELAIEVWKLEALAEIEFEYSSTRVRLHPYLCRHVSGKAVPLASQQLRWVRAKELREYRFPPANDALIEELIERLEHPARAGHVDFDALET
jgi:A/G-specific adenine glycosylase